MIMLIPAPVVLPAKTTMVRKISLVLLFSGGFFVMIASILRVTYVMVVSGPSRHAFSCLFLFETGNVDGQELIQNRLP